MKYLKHLSLFCAIVLVFSITSLFKQDIKVQAADNDSASAAVDWARSKIGQSIDYDGVYGAQCVDLAYAYVAYLGHSELISGDAIDFAYKTLPSGWSYQSSPQAGDIVIWDKGVNMGIYVNSGWYNEYANSESGHIGIVVNVKSSSIETVEQNTESGYGYGGGVSARIRERKLGTAIKYIRPFGGNIPGTLVTIPDFYAYIVRQDVWRMVESSPSNSNNAQLTASSNPDTDANCIWRFVKQSNGAYVIYNQGNGYVLDAYSAGTANGTNIYTYKEYVGGKNQQWYLYNTGSSNVLKSANCDRVLDCNGGYSTAGTNIQLFEYNGSKAQLFSVYLIAQRTTVSTSDGFAYLSTKDSKLNIENSSSYNVQVRSGSNDTKDPKQVFWFCKLSLGFY